MLINTLHHSHKIPYSYSVWLHDNHNYYIIHTVCTSLQKEIRRIFLASQKGNLTVLQKLWDEDVDIVNVRFKQWVSY